MIIQAWVKINKEELSDRANIIYFSLPDSEEICGQVVKIHEETSRNVYRCDIKIYKDSISSVLKSMSKERMKLENRIRNPDSIPE